MIEVGVIGGTGYTGKELIRYILGHPEFKLGFATSRSESGRGIGEVHPNFSGLIDLDFISPDPYPKVDLVFLAVPHTKGMEYVPKALDRGMKVVDLSADYRISVDSFEKYYSTSHIDLGREAVYGLTEYNRERICGCDFVANPGCFSTGALLSVLPIITNDVGFEYVLFDSKTGISGAGADASDKTHYPNVSGEVSPYNLVSHRHNAELDKVLGENEVSGFGFTPHIVPMVRGIETTTHILGSERKDYFDLYEDFYSDSSFIRIKEEEPRVKSVRGTNYADIGAFEYEENRMVLASTIDNLGKGAAGQAVQNANLMFDLGESLGLKELGLDP